MTTEKKTQRIKNRLRNLNGYFINQLVLTDLSISQVINLYKNKCPSGIDFNGIIQGLTKNQAETLFTYIDDSLRLDCCCFEDKISLWNQISELLNFESLFFFPHRESMNPTTYSALEGFSEVFNFLYHHEKLTAFDPDFSLETRSLQQFLQENPTAHIVFIESDNDYDTDDSRPLPPSSLCFESKSDFIGIHYNTEEEYKKAVARDLSAVMMLHRDIFKAL
mmetsp:Transcript_22375/g.33337  ORF Transcript_22375/g.33337 Transcript_22375/m.33337 type:complete len:221 (+) Transcript_22375:121-783(+)